MFTLAAFLVFQATSTFDIAAYFPLAEGTKWEYEEVIDRSKSVYTDVAQKAVQFKDIVSVPIHETTPGKLKGVSTYYNVTGDTVYVVSLTGKKAMDDPYPLMRAGASGAEWTYAGQMNMSREDVRMALQGTSRPGKTRDLFGKSRRTIDVHLEVTLGNQGEPPIRVIQDMVYAEGVGLVDMTESGVINGNKSLRSRHLTSFTPAATR